MFATFNCVWHASEQMKVENMLVKYISHIHNIVRKKELKIIKIHLQLWRKTIVADRNFAGPPADNLFFVFLLGKRGGGRRREEEKKNKFKLSKFLERSTSSQSNRKKSRPEENPTNNNNNKKLFNSTRNLNSKLKLILKLNIYLQTCVLVRFYTLRCAVPQNRHRSNHFKSL